MHNWVITAMLASLLSSSGLHAAATDTTNDSETDLDAGQKAQAFQLSTPRPLARPEHLTNTAAIFQIVSAHAPRPRARPDSFHATLSRNSPTDAAASTGFQTWLKGFPPRARASGISQSTLNRAFRGVTYDPDVIRRDRNQSEFTKTIWEYLDSAASNTRVKSGIAALQNERSVLQRIEARYGVDKEVVVAIWGLESSFGSYRGKMDVIRSLATLAFDGRRGAFFESQLIAALKILQAGDVEPRRMTGSWAGAMGHTQFIPTSYLDHAVDFNGDGRRDIWSDTPADALASAAAYLKNSGWVEGQPWGVEVSLPTGFDYALASRTIKKSPKDWVKLGIRDVNGQKVPNHGTASILLPAGSTGAAFMIFNNFAVIERYNSADAYVIGVGHLSDRIKGGSKIKAPWPRGDRALTLSERLEMQRLLSKRGFDTQGVDGKIGPNTIDAVRAYQQAKGLTPDGYASVSLLKRLR